MVTESGIAKLKRNKNVKHHVNAEATASRVMSLKILMLFVFSMLSVSACPLRVTYSHTTSASMPAHGHDRKQAPMIPS
jgi:hypothetical protein